jgi:hypothetical protein
MRPGLKIGLKIDGLFFLKIAGFGLKITRGGEDHLKITDIDLKIGRAYIRIYVCNQHYMH